MGEKIKDLGHFYVGKEKILVELNDAYSKEYSKYDIHIQGEKIQYSLAESDFLKLVSAAVTAKQRLDFLKANKQEKSRAD
ncbi:MAG TPA: hypothetical protein DCR27_05035 [Lachnospiraceae bacterium]|nr:hypothetical protein [Lachnospiraceae bacterium]